LGGDTAPSSDDSKDRGIEFRWHNGSAAKTGFFGFDDSTGYLTFIPDATNTSEVFSGTLGDIQATNFRGALFGNANTATTLATARTINGVSFNGSADITVADSTKLPLAGGTMTGAISFVAGQTWPTFNQNTTGNAATATTLQTARTINGVSFNGSANVTIADSTKLPLAGGTMTGAISFAAGQTWPTFNQSTTGNAATATTLQTARTINGTSFSGSANIKATEWFHSDRDFAAGTLVTTDINYAVSSGDPFILEIRGNSYGDAVPYDVQYQGYIYADTIINHGGYSNGTNITGLVAINVGGNLCFWWPRQSYWNGFNVRVYTASATYALNRVTSITSTAKPTSTKEVALSANIRQSLHSSNYTIYSPTLTGSGASGTWGISVTGNAATATNATNSTYVASPDGDRVAGNKLPTTNPRTVRFDFATAGSVTGAAGNYAGVMTYAPWDGTSASTGDSSYQLAFTNQSGVNASGPPQLLLRNGINSTWNSWHTVITTASTQSAPRATRANGNFYIDDNYGNTVVGVYASTRYQGVYAMGDAYKMAADGASLANMYGIAWSHPNAGGAAGNLTDHGMLIINNGGFRCAISNSIVASGNITAYSDERLKTNWRDMPDNYVSRLAKVKVGIYDRIDTENGTQVGVSAQSFQELLPQAITTAKDDMQTLSVNYGGAALASAVELAKDNCELRARIERLEALIHTMIHKD
jgi:hypothetical protein